jgi:hypothetical protein
MAKNITCTRCLGKGYVDNKDLKRLKRKSVWDENSECKFCKGKGTITENFASKHNPNSEKFPNVNDNSGLIDFLELTSEEKNREYREYIEFKQNFRKRKPTPEEELKYSEYIKDEIKKDELSDSKYKIGVPIFLVISIISMFFIKKYMPIESQAGRAIVIVFLIIFCIWVTKGIIDSIYNKD